MRYLYRRLVFYLVALWAAVTLNFAIPRLMPGNPAEVFLAAHYQQFQGDPHALQTIEAVLGVSRDPMPVQYGHYLLALVHGDLGISTSFYPARVSTVIAFLTVRAGSGGGGGGSPGLTRVMRPHTSALSSGSSSSATSGLRVALGASTGTNG